MALIKRRKEQCSNSVETVTSGYDVSCVVKQIRLHDDMPSPAVVSLLTPTAFDLVARHLSWPTLFNNSTIATAIPWATAAAPR